MSQNRRINSTRHADVADLPPNLTWLAFFKEVRRLAALAEARRQQKQQMESGVDQEKADTHDERRRF